MTYNIWCRVSGGVTGTRESLLKDSGRVVEFKTLEAAEAEAERLNDKMNHQHSTASFSYKAVEAQ
jgi:hypothetical protein